MRPVFALLTDFGQASPYVGQLHAALLAGCREAAIIDLFHEVTPHAVAEAAFLLAASLPHLPPASIVLAVVDPGVGTDRALVLLETPAVHVLAPDNGLLAPIAHLGTPWRLAVPEGACATFHGRDVLAPAAVRLAQGAPASAVAKAWGQTPLTPLPVPAPPPEGGILAQVVHVDRFGNLLLHLPASQELPARVRVAGHPARSVRTYGELAPGELGLVRGSQGVWELARREASAANLLGMTAGGWVRLEPAP